MLYATTALSECFQTELGSSYLLRFPPNNVLMIIYLENYHTIYLPQCNPFHRSHQHNPLFHYNESIGEDTHG